MRRSNRPAFNRRACVLTCAHGRMTTATCFRYLGFAASRTRRTNHEMMPWRTAYRITSGTLCRFSFCKMCVRWVSTVLRLRLRSFATSLLVLLRRSIAEFHARDPLANDNYPRHSCGPTSCTVTIIRPASWRLQTCTTLARACCAQLLSASCTTWYTHVCALREVRRTSRLPHALVVPVCLSISRACHSKAA